MSETTIEWADYTFNPWSGCAKISAGCLNCYAAALPPKMRRGAVWGEGQERMPAGDAYWHQPRLWARRAGAEGVRRRVFCASTADVFEDRPDLDGLRWRLWELIRETPELDWLLLTKRPERMASWADEHGWHPNAWAGASVENQAAADARLPHLLKVPARVRFLSCEPLLGRVDLRGTRLDWIIVGGESGPRARPMHPDWVRGLRDQAALDGAPFLFKQWGEWAPAEEVEANGTDWPGMDVRSHSWPDAPLRETARRMGQGEIAGPIGSDTHVLRVGKKAAGRRIDGVEHLAFPRG